MTKYFHKTKVLKTRRRRRLVNRTKTFLLQSKGSVSNISRGCPKKTVEESSSRSKLRKIGSILSDFSTEEITYAAQVSLNKEGKRRVSFLINCVLLLHQKKWNVWKSYLLCHWTNKLVILQKKCLLWWWKLIWLKSNTKLCNLVLKAKLIIFIPHIIK